jgi:hypothetical protein
VEAEEARQIGLANRVDPPEKLWEGRAGVRRHPAEACAAGMDTAKHIINTCPSVDLGTGRILERLGRSIPIQTQDNEEGMAAFLEKRPAKFRGHDMAERLYVTEVSGSGAGKDAPTLLLLHGMAGNGELWRPLLEVLAADNAISSAAGPDIRPLLAAATAPVMLACGERDHMVNIRQLQAVGRPAVELPVARHNPHVEQPRLPWQHARAHLTPPGEKA